MKRRGRPLGHISESVFSLIRERAALGQPLTLRAVAHAAQLSYTDADKTVRRLKAGGWIRYGEPLPSVDRGRPPHLLLPSEEAGQQQKGAELHFCMGMMIRTGR
jgi:hypothetical protein